MEKCFCHLIDRITGEIYVVKDKEARQRLQSCEEAIINIKDDVKNIPAIQSELAKQTTRIDTVAERCTRMDGQIISLSDAVALNTSRHWEQDASIRALTTRLTAVEARLAALEGKVV